MKVRDCRSAGDAKSLGEFLRAHRERRSPEDLGLPNTGCRRTPGLRREEVATLSGVGLAWYTWMDRGRVIPSRQVLEAVADTLGLHGAELRHALVLCGLDDSMPPDQDAEAELAGSVRGLLDTWESSPAVLLDSRFDVIGWNAAYTAIWSDPSLLTDNRRNYMWLTMGDPAIRDQITDWEAFARAIRAQFQTQIAQQTGDTRVREIRQLLREDFPEFDAWWHCQGVGDFTTHAVNIQVPHQNELTLTFSAFRPVELPDHMVIVQTPKEQSDRELVLNLARGLRGVRMPDDDHHQ